MNEHRIIGNDAMLLIAAIEREQEMQARCREIHTAVVERIRELGELEGPFNIAIDGNAVVALWKDKEEAEQFDKKKPIRERDDS